MRCPVEWESVVVHKEQTQHIYVHKHDEFTLNLVIPLSGNSDEVLIDIIHEPTVCTVPNCPVPLHGMSLEVGNWMDLIAWANYQSGVLVSKLGISTNPWLNTDSQ